VSLPSPLRVASSISTQTERFGKESFKKFQSAKSRGFDFTNWTW